MDSAILNSLPSIHTTLIGIGAAFYSAHAIYAYQKIQESRIKLERTSKDATDIFNHLDGLVFGGADHLLTNGELEWDTCKIIIRSSK